ncbi:putative transcriptional regulator, TetR family protein [Sphaerisporangium krabiense]|uniref:AcrR family transcriptional regulator n=1 Tax=Sphaerisporangium krabiense TaxID=763782 RepID=A0A7W8Z0F2_9ACTN|nr:TetR family transcriptional regulator [Sphaerisporangium krabiense]MBB5625169.1 AcrR family transcriptional regulator [Sphaerisporangium krabiense]GII64323.1 putative transcriptional regulator, TetR family protein [Sphaerisporangium krabiense]
MRIAEPRAPASPTSKRQIARRERILRAAAELGARDKFETVQMHEVAKNADVAIATLYRYFPSKNALFSALLKMEVGAFDAGRPRGRGTDPVTQAAELLVGLSRHLLARPVLAAAMIQASTAEYFAAAMDDVEPTKDALGRILLRIIGAEKPNEQDVSVVRLLAHCWWGALVSTLSGQTTPEKAKADIELAARLLLAPYSGR